MINELVKGEESVVFGAICYCWNGYRDRWDIMPGNDAQLYENGCRSLCCSSYLNGLGGEANKWEWHGGGETKAGDCPISVPVAVEIASDHLDLVVSS